MACYRLSDGAPLWQHRNTARFWEPFGGPGPRATPTLHGGRVYALGATGILNALDAETGEVTWSRSAATDAGRETPYWGFSGSPLVADEMLLVSADGALIAYTLETGQPRWQRATSRIRHSYSSPHLMSIAGTEQVVLLTGEGAVAVAPTDGALLWEHAWPGEPIVQPAALAGGDLLISAAACVAWPCSRKTTRGGFIDRRH